MTQLTQWDVLLVIMTLLGLVGVCISWVEKLTKPMQALNESNIRLADCVHSLEQQLNKFLIQNEKDHDEIWETVNKHDESIAKHDTDIAVLKLSNKESRG